MGEMEALEKNRTWDIVQKPEEKIPVECKQVFTAKYKTNGSIERYKARLVAKVYPQTHGIDYQETFALVAKLNTIRVPLTRSKFRLASPTNGCEKRIPQQRFRGSGLYGPATWIHQGKQSWKNLQTKSLYGLKQSPRAWFNSFSNSLHHQGYT